MNTADSDALAARFWQELRDVRTGMLGLVGAREAHSQPMTAHVQDEGGPLWFFARADGELTQATGGGQRAVFHYVGPDHELYACVHGDLSVDRDRAVMDRFWGPEVARWFPDGPDGGSAVLLRFEPEEAQIWLPAKSADRSVLSLRGGQASADIRAKTAL